MALAAIALLSSFVIAIKVFACWIFTNVFPYFKSGLWRFQSVVSVAGEAAGQAEKYIEAAQPYAFSTFESIMASDPLVLATGAGALLLVYFLAPPLLSSVSYAARGYKGTCLTSQSSCNPFVLQNPVIINRILSQANSVRL